MLMGSDRRAVKSGVSLGAEARVISAPMPLNVAQGLMQQYRTIHILVRNNGVAFSSIQNEHRFPF